MTEADIVAVLHAAMLVTFKMSLPLLLAPLAAGVFRGGRLGRDSVSVSISGASAGWWDHLPLPGRCGGRA
jgi:hypothetical protein